ncbi:unnamed protein product [Ilex paraguariensis]|uniref:DNA-binding protein BIN4 n=1 Tax=Ilex paraguariensis TaxID=185542 RepID=A0ABC8TSJ4_9AQUA
MSSSRETSPDWLRCFQAPTQSALSLSLASQSPPEDNTVSEDEDSLSIKKLIQKETSHSSEKNNSQDTGESPVNNTLKAKCRSKSKNKKADLTPSKKRKRDKEGNGVDGEVAKKETSVKTTKPHETKHPVWTLSSDSESSPDTISVREHNSHHEELSAHEIGGQSSLKEASKVKSPKKQLKTEDHIPKKRQKLSSHMNKEGNDGEMELVEDEITEKHIGPSVSSSRLPLVLSEKVQRSKALVECEGESVDLSGDVGAVGRIIISDNQSGNQEMLLDLKGTIYKTTIVPSRTFCVVSFGQSEAKVEAIMNDFIQLKPQSNVYEAETMVEGTLDGFSFDSEDEADKMPKVVTHQTDQNEEAEKQSNGKPRKKPRKPRGQHGKRGKLLEGSRRRK